MLSKKPRTISEKKRNVIIPPKNQNNSHFFLDSLKSNEYSFFGDETNSIVLDVFLFT